MCFLMKRLTGINKPSDIIPRSSIEWDKLGNIKIDVTRLNIPFTAPPIVWLPEIASTKSMLPVFGAGHHNFFLQAANKLNQMILTNWLADETANGYQNIIVFPAGRTGGQVSKIAHRVVKVGTDASGRFFRAKGDNNLRMDPEIIRDEHILYISAGIAF